MEGLRVLVAEDQGEVRGMVVSLLSSEYQVVGAVGNGEQLVQSATFLRPDVIVSDIAMPLMHGLRARKELLSKGIESPFVFITVMNVESLLSSVKDGPVGFVHKTDMVDELKLAVDAVSAGNSYLSKSFRETRETE